MRHPSHDLRNAAALPGGPVLTPLPIPIDKAVIPMLSSGPKAPRRWLRRGLRHWFVRETPLLTALNAAISLGLFALAFMLMGPVGLARAISPDFVAATSLPATRLAAYAGATLFVLALLTAARTIFSRTLLRRILGLVLSAPPLVAGLWLTAAALYDSGVPNLFKPLLLLRGAALAADLDYVDAAIVPFLVPAAAIVIAFVFSVRQIKSAASAHKASARKYLALAGLAASTCTLALGAYAGELRNLGIFAAPDDSVAVHAQTVRYVPPFAAGVPCHVSDGFGERRNPFDTTKSEFHPGVDMAVAAGTPVHTMAPGVVVFAGDDGGFGNMVAVRARDGSAAPPVIVEGHMESLLVSAGATVRAGDVVGLAGSTGRSTGPHVHLQLCPEGHLNRGGAFVCGAAADPYETWRTLSAIARASCSRGPIVPLADLMSWIAPLAWFAPHKPG